MYCTLDQLKERLPEKVIQQLTDDDRLGVIDSGRVDAAIARAAAEIDAWCGRRYSVPFAEAPAVIRELCADLAIYYLYARKAEKVPETRTDAHKNALRTLEQISKGLVSLGVDTLPPPAPAAVSGGASFDAGERRFSRTSLRDM